MPLGIDCRKEYFYPIIHISLFHSYECISILVLLNFMKYLHILLVPLFFLTILFVSTLYNTLSHFYDITSQQPGYLLISITPSVRDKLSPTSAGCWLILIVDTCSVLLLLSERLYC